jgi:hypothetical protein
MPVFGMKQAKLLRRMLDSGLEAILVKIAAIGASQGCEVCANGADCLNISRQSAGAILAAWTAPATFAGRRRGPPDECHASNAKV